MIRYDGHEFDPTTLTTEGIGRLRKETGKGITRLLEDSSALYEDELAKFVWVVMSDLGLTSQSFTEWVNGRDYWRLHAVGTRMIAQMSDRFITLGSEVDPDFLSLDWSQSSAQGS